MTRWLLAVLLTATAVVGGVLVRGPAEDAGDSPRRTTSASPSASASPAAEPSAPVLPPPRVRSCYRLTFEQALDPVDQVRARACDQQHTARTTYVGRVDDLVEGGAAAIDSPRVQAAVADDCPARVATFLGGPVQAFRLSMFRPVWFTPSLDQERAGQQWYRCDVIALAAEGELTPLAGRLEGLLATVGWKGDYGLCGTAQPGTPGFERITCARRHSWQAISTVPVVADRFPGVDVVRARGETPCTDAARALADDPLDFQWGYEWPTLEQWRAGVRYGVCWAPA